VHFALKSLSTNTRRYRAPPPAPGICLAPWLDPVSDLSIFAPATSLGVSGARRLRGASEATAATAAALGLAGLLVWKTPFQWLGSFGSGLQPMAPVTAVGLMLLGVTVILGVRRPSRRRSTAVALFVLVFACARLAALGPASPRWAQDALAAEANSGALFLGHASPITSVAFILAAAAVGTTGAGGLFASALALLSLVVVLGYAFGTPLLYGGTVVPMALPTAVAFAALGAAVLASSGPNRLPLRPFSGPSVQAQLLRGLLPILAAMVVAECLLFRFDPGLNPALRAALASLVLVGVVSTGGARLARSVGGMVDSADARRSRAEQELRAGEQRLRDGEELFRSAFDSATEGVCLVGADGRFLRTNPALSRILGYTAAELSLRAFNDVTHPEDKAVGADVRARLLAGGAGGTFDKRYIHRDGHIIHAHVAAALVRPADGREPFFVTHVVDMTERRKAEQALAASETLLRQFIKHSPAAVAMFDTEMRYLQVSDRWLADYHLERERVVGRCHYDVFPDLPERWKEVHRRVLAGAVESCLEDEFVRADGTAEWLHWEARPWLTSDGAIGGLTIFTRLVTEGRRAAAELVRLSRAIEQSAESVLITDPAGTIVYVNPAFETVTGYSREEALGQNPRILKSGRQGPEFYRQMWTTLTRGRTWTGRITNRRKDGSLLEEDAAISPVRDSSGRVVNYVAVKRDITHEKSLEQQLLQAQKLEAVGRLAGGVAHDFNNIVGVILGYGEAVQRKLPAEDPLRGKVQQILRAAGRAADLTRQLLAFSRKQVLQPRALDLNEALSGMEKMLRRLIGEDVELTLRPEPGLGPVRADPGQVEQVLMNLAVNARDAMPQGGNLTIETSNLTLDCPLNLGRWVLPPGRYAVLAVTDDGEGISPDVEAHIFEPFFTTKEAGKGTGLGLSTVYGIVKQSEGFISVHSEIGVGTTFTIYLPRIDEQPGEEAEEDRTAVPGGTETILVVEDEAALRDLLRDVLEDNGYTVLAASDGTEALRTAERHVGAIHLLLTDVVMPGMTGPHLARQFSASRPDAKIVYVSGYSEEAVASRGRLGPGDLLLHKPFAPDALLRSVRDVLDAR
jgi:two-component system, cell cycle sensor histidine kinase and response regulator CckA